MRFLAFLSSLVLISSCAPVRETVVPGPAAAVPEEAIAATKGKPDEPSPAVEPPRVASGEFSGIRFEGFTFDARSHRLVVVDQPGGPGSEFPDAAAAGRSRGGLAAINAGFFTPTGEPLGQVVSSGKLSGAWNSASSLGSGVWYDDSAGNPAIRRREALGRSGAKTVHELIQSGPLLRDNGRMVAGLDSIKPSVRSFLLWDGGSRWWLGRASPCTLAQLAAALSSAQPAGWPVVHALNLDGGRSADLWISESLAGSPVTRRSSWNRPVRNFLVLVAK